jgi:2-polyprenyl-3-methyl-5-hydroxy-6-metoxy-1,4-benzoquinol methylase
VIKSWRLHEKDAEPQEIVAYSKFGKVRFAVNQHNIVKEHFNELAEKYWEEISDHVREHLIERMWNLTADYFFDNSKIIDIGCGDGTNVAFLRNKGID